jgi:hypothetical protein
MNLCFRATLLLSSILLASAVAYSQYRPLEKHKFEDGGYTLIGIFEHHADHPAQKEVGEFYTDDISVLNSVKKSWNFPRGQYTYACGYHYYVALLREGKVLDEFSINLECKEIVTSIGSRVFNPALLTRMSPRLKQLFGRSQEFSSIREARTFWSRALLNRDFVFAVKPPWLEYEGSFRFSVQCPSGNVDCYTTGKGSEITAQVRKEITTKYPNEKFDLKTSGGSSKGEVFFEIICNKTLESEFTFYNRWNKEDFGAWQPFHLSLRSYWKKK